MGVIGCHSRCESGSTGMATPGVLFAHSFKSISCFGRTCNNGRREFFGGLFSVLEHFGHFRLSCRWGRVRVSSRSVSDGVRWGFWECD